MCGTCGCGTDGNGPTILKPGEHHHHHDGHHHHSHAADHTHQRVVEVERDILNQNAIMAAKNKGYFEAKNIFALNLVSAPGSGKTSILEKTLSDLKNEIPFYVIEGDQQTCHDADRIDALDIPVIQINTGKGCHLESEMVYNAVKKLEVKNDAILMIENVGNLVCPSMFDLGENKRVVIISTTEGEDKPIKYPDIFHTADVCIINKIDLLPYVNINIEKLKNYALQVNPNLTFFEMSTTNNTGMDAWYKWLKSNL